MIVRPRPNSLQLFFIMRGSIVPHIASRLLVIIAFSCLVVWLARTNVIALVGMPIAPFSFLGLALSVFLGFRNNACYDRWWEARKQWGELIVQARSFAREIRALLPDAESSREQIHSLIAFAHALAASLRNISDTAAIRIWLPADRADAIARHKNLADAILRDINQSLAESLRAGQTSDILYANLVQHLNRLSGIQASCERIRNTPTPFAYSLLLHRTAWLFCLMLPFGLVDMAGLMTPVIVAITAYTFFGLDALGDELEEPFGITDNDLPLDAMVRTIEIDLLEALGERELPLPLQPQGYRLQ